MSEPKRMHGLLPTDVLMYAEDFGEFVVECSDEREAKAVKSRLYSAKRKEIDRWAKKENKPKSSPDAPYAGVTMSVEGSNVIARQQKLTGYIPGVDA